MDVLSKLKQLLGGGKTGKVPVIDLRKRFELLSRTGQGTMSKVWRARDQQTGRVVCLKILDKAETAKFEARFVGLKRPSEGVICMGLHHPNIVRTLEHGMTKEGDQFLAMELIEGMGLNFLIETQSPQINHKRNHYLVQMADALEYVHQQRYIHRDICPRNVLVTKDDVVKLIDFGLTIPYRPEFCKPGNRTGKLDYLAPEVIKRMATDHRVDLFALGVTAYEVFTGQLPWEKGESLQVIQSHINQPGTDPHEHRPDLNERTAKFLIKAIQRRPADRYQSAAEFRDALKKLPKD